MSSNKNSAEHRSARTIADRLANPPANRRMAPWQRRLQVTAVAVLLIGYAALSHYSTGTPDAKGLGATLSIAPVLLIGLILIWRWNRPWIAVAVGALACAILYRCWRDIESNYEWADLVQQCGAYGLVSLSFARSLLTGHVPLCTQLAEKMHGQLTPAEIAYTRRASAAWAVFYALITVTILVLFFGTPLRVWSLFVNFAVFGLITLMGIADHAIRRRVLPRHPPGGMLSIIRRSLIG